MSGIPIDWIKKEKTPEGKKKVEGVLRNSVLALSIVYKLLEDKEKDLNSVKASDYENPSWAYLQAHKNGKLEQLQELKRLLSFVNP